MSVAATGPAQLAIPDITLKVPDPKPAASDANSTSKTTAAGNNGTSKNIFSYETALYLVTQAASSYQSGKHQAARTPAKKTPTLQDKDGIAKSNAPTTDDTTSPGTTASTNAAGAGSSAPAPAVTVTDLGESSQSFGGTQSHNFEQVAIAYGDKSLGSVWIATNFENRFGAYAVPIQDSEEKDELAEVSGLSGAALDAASDVLSQGLNAVFQRLNDENVATDAADKAAGITPPAY